ncbi:MAG: hypothetical protein ACK2T6_01720 [Anaerolineae bacterium]|jgi:hypothetical protein
MGATDLESQFTLAAAMYALTALVWVGSAIVAFSGYRAFRLGVDLGWFATFLLFAFIRASQAYVMWLTRSQLAMTSLGEAPLIDLSIGYRVSFAALEIVAAFAVFFLFRMRSRRPRRERD